MNVHIDIDFIDDPKNKEKIKNIMRCLHDLTGRELWIPYKFDKNGFASFIHASEEIIIFRPDDYDLDEERKELEKSEDEDSLSFFLEVDPSIGKEKEKK